MSFLVTPTRADPALREHVVQRESLFATDKIAIVDVEGLISSSRSGGLFGVEGPNPLSQFKEKLDLAARDGAVKAVLLRINSPGGGVTASDVMYGELKRFREKTGKPIIASMMDLGASGGYYIACAADRIYAMPTTVTGSIGVIMITPDLSGLMRKIGVDTNVIKSGPLKDAGSPFRDMQDNERAVFQGMIDRMCERFLDVVAAGRAGKLSRDRIRELADGRVYLGEEAKALGLVDEVGGLPEAIAAAKREAGIAEGKVLVVEYARSFEHRPNAYAETPTPAVNVFNVKLPEWLDRPGPEFLYLWAPAW